MSTIFPGPLQGLSVITEDAVEHPLMGNGQTISLLYLDGTGVSPVRRILEKAPFQHGMSDRGYRGEPRRMTLALMLNGANEAATDALRDQIAGWFSPSNSPLKLKAKRDDLTERQIDCYVDGFIDFPQNAGERMGTGQKLIIPLVAPDPSWYYPTQQTSTMALVNGTNNLDLTISGMTADDWPIIDITGPLNTGFEIQHAPGDESIIFSSAIPGGETFRIDLRPGYKTVRRTSDNANRMSYINTASLGAFSEMRVMSEKVTRATGSPTYTTTNRFVFGSAAGTSGASAAAVYWYKRYASL